MPDPLDDGARHDRGAADANNFLSQLDPKNKAHEAGSDPFLAAAAHNADFGQGVRVSLGKIVCSLPYVNWYLVQIDDARAPKPGCHISADTGHLPVGVRGGSPLPPNSRVVLLEPPSTSECLILGALPIALTDSNLTQSDWISQGSNTGFRAERYYWDLLTKLKKQGGIKDYSDGRPIDSTACAEWGRFAETGLGIYLDSFMAYLRVDEATGFYAFYQDQLARMAGHNLDIRSAGHETVARDDQGEFHYFHGDTPYCYEGLGAYKYGEKVFRETDDHKVLFQPTEAKFEPVHDDQQAFYRYREWGGYLGQGRIREIAAPPKESGLQRYQDRDPTHGLFREQIGLTGHVSWQTAKGFDLVKRSLLPVAKQVKLPESAEASAADNETNYKAAGRFGAGPDHRVKDIKTEGDLPNVRNAAGIADRQAVTANWYGLHPFALHQKDFYLPEETELPKLNSLQTRVAFDELTSKGWIDRPSAKKIRVDDRYEEVDYYENTAGISVTDDGGVVIFDGYGGEIRLVGGNIQISCPGNVFLQPGRSLIGLAGDDVCLRAQKSAELTAGQNDLRLCARKNMQFLACEGGVLIESQAEQVRYTYDGKIGEDIESSGIVLKAGKSQVVTWARDIYLRTGSSGGNVDAGEIVLDADKGQQPIRTLSSRFDRQVQDSCGDYFGIDNVTAGNVFSGQSNQFGSQVVLKDNLLVTGRAIFGGNVAIAGGHLATEYAEQASFFVAPLKDQALSAVNSAIQQAASAADEIKELGNTGYKQHTADYYEAQKPGNDTVQKQAAFSYRNEKQYGTEDFKLPETRWQQMAAAMGGGRGWQEPPIQYQGNDQLPYPGHAAWTKPSLLSMMPKYFNWATGTDVARGTGGAYADPQLPNWNPKTPDGGYLTITD